MALLHRFTRLNDRLNTGVFTFIVTRTVTRDLHRDAVTKDFMHGNHRWALSFLRADKTLGVFLVIRNPAPGSLCCVDFTLTLLNREHFSQNEALSEKRVAFSMESPAHGAAKWLPLSELPSRRFADETGEFLVELTLANVSTIFDADIKIPSNYLTDSIEENFEDSRKFATVMQQAARIELLYFSFGGFEWNVTIFPYGNPDDSESSKIPKVLLNRLTGFDNPCRVQYRLILGQGSDKIESGLLDQISDLSGRIRGFSMKESSSLRDLMSHRNNALHVQLQMVSANVISEAKVTIHGGVSPQQGPLGLNPPPTANCYDRDKQSWTVETDFERDYLRLKLFFTDISTVPRNHLRYVAWNTYVIRAPPGGGKESVLAINAPHSAYYVQDGMDLGVLIDVEIPTRSLREQLSPYVNSCNQLTVHLEWLENKLLFGANYHRYDDIARTQQQQMKREIAALQSENLTMEQQLLSYHKAASFGSLAIHRSMRQRSGNLSPSSHHRVRCHSDQEDQVNCVSRRLADLRGGELLRRSYDGIDFN